MNSKVTIIVLGLIVVFSVLVLWLIPKDEIDGDELQEYMDNLDEMGDLTSDTVISEPFIRKQAERLASQLDKPIEYADELVDIHLLINHEDIDIVLVYNTGGFGGSPLEEDPEWPSIMHGIQDELFSMGYTSTIIEHKRAEYGGLKFVEAVGDIMDNYSATDYILAAKAAFLTKYNPDLKIIVTGRSAGAVFSSEVMELLEDNPSVYSIQAGRPFWYESECDSDRSLIIGEGSDPLSSGNIWSIVRSNIGRVPSSSPPEEGSIQVLKWYLEAPNHAYTWEIIGESGRSKIVEFLEHMSRN